MVTTLPAESTAHIIKANGRERLRPVCHGWASELKQYQSHAGAGKHKKEPGGGTQNGSNLPPSPPALF